MKRIQKIICLTILMFVTINTTVTSAKKDDSVVKLVVSAEATTKQEAIDAALRNAVEQACGVFLSATTIIENDELVKDRIASVTSGNVVSFKEIDGMHTLNGKYFATLEVVVSINRLLSYSHQDNMNSSLNGAALMARNKLIKLNRENTRIALENLFEQLLELVPDLFDFQVTSHYVGVADNDRSTILDLQLKVLETPNTQNFVRVFTSTLEALSIDKKEALAMHEEGYKIYTCDIETLKEQNKKATTWRPLIAELGSILFTGKTIDEHNQARELKHSNDLKKTDYYLYEMYTPEMCERLNQAIKNAYNNYLIKDNMGTYYEFPLSYANLMYFQPGKFVKYQYWDGSFVKVTKTEDVKKGKSKQVKYKLYLMNQTVQRIKVSSEYAGNITQFIRVIPTDTELREYFEQRIDQQTKERFVDEKKYQWLKENIHLSGFEDLENKLIDAYNTISIQLRSKYK